MIIKRIQPAMDYFDEETRKATYRSWVFNSSDPCSAAKMAEAGFIYTGSTREPDSAQCFYCKKSLDGWESSDQPWKEHLKHAKNCDFAKMQKSQNEWTLNEWHDLKVKYEETLIREKYEKIKDQKRKMFDVIKSNLW